MADTWRFLLGCSERELRERLAVLDSSTRNFELSDGATDRGWRRQLNEQVVGLERPGRPEPNGHFVRAKRMIEEYGFSDPRIVVGHFDENDPLEGRRMLLELKVLGFGFLCGVVVTQVFDGADGKQTVFGFRYETLHPHLEAGHESFVLTKDHASGVIRFSYRIAVERRRVSDLVVETRLSRPGRRLSNSLALALLLALAGGVGHRAHESYGADEP